VLPCAGGLLGFRPPIVNIGVLDRRGGLPLLPANDNDPSEAVDKRDVGMRGPDRRSIRPAYLLTEPTRMLRGASIETHLPLSVSDWRFK